MTNTFSKEIQLRYYDCDVKNRLTLTNLVHYLIDVSTSQVNQLNENAGSDPIEEAGYVWVIIQYNMDIDRLPSSGEDIRIETSYETFTKIFTYRNFKVYDAADNLIITVTSTWLLMDAIERKMVRITSDLVQNFTNIQEEKHLKRRPKPRFEETSERFEEAFKVRYSNIDINRHVNNSHYFEWMQEPLGADFLKRHVPTAININFSKEVLYGTTIDSVVSKEVSNNEIVTMHKIKTGDKINSEAEFHWKKSD